MCETVLLSMCDRVLPNIASSMQSYVYTIVCFSEMPLTWADIFPDFIVLISPHEHSADPIPSVFEVAMKATKPRTLVGGKEYFWCHQWELHPAY